MIALRETAAGAVLPVHAQPGARRAGIVGIYNDRLKVSVTSAAEKGRANEAIVEVLCQALGVRRQQVELIAGATSRSKQFLIRQIALDELRRRVEQVLAR